MTWLGRLTLLALLSGASGCNLIGRADSACLVFKPIYVSPQDVLTDATIAAVLGHDETGKRLCGW